jgi:hypothetical protein
MLKDFTSYEIGTTDLDEYGKTGPVELILPNCLAKSLDNYHIIKTNIDAEKGNRLPESLLRQQPNETDQG